ncbi:MAG TPA: UDP-3-O-(3-hydroxymyristoyl)glucosamine N-acyltransferase [Rhizomicrobium sp.]|jgi:UDP-3-O-[3-hydroxymyristoyl] glucosamine N-acyltransferase|nr:UDP-3-O-(3-hydroxymyristoyl)glucosamine N-acyltransferase [Rhizomicrobium sp.]
MADPRFYNNRGPFTLAEVCARVSAFIPDGVDPSSAVADLATLPGAGSQHLTFCAAKKAAEALTVSRAGYCFIDASQDVPPTGSGPCLLICQSVQSAFAAAARLFYPEHGLGRWSQDRAIDPGAKLDEGVWLAPGAVLGPGAEIGAHTRIGPNAVIGRGVTIGRDCEIGSHVGVGFAYVGDGVDILPGAQIGQPGFGFAGSARGHTKIPQLGRVIIQDHVEIGACSVIDRGALGDTVVGEGTKIDNLVHIGHNSRTGRHCIIVAQTGVSGSCELGDFVVLGGQAGVSDHVRVGDRARLAARGAFAAGDYPGGADYGGTPARPMGQWRRELAAVALLAKRRGRERDG